MTSQNKFVEFVASELISHGPIAEVYLGKSSTTGRKVALKLFSLAGPVDSNSNMPNISSYLDTELGILLDNNCPNIGRILTFGTTLDAQHLYLALEFVSGVHLDRAAKDSSHEALLNLFMQIAHALGHLHNRGFVHG